MTLPLRVIGDRILVTLAVIDLAPELTNSGLYLAQSLGAAVTGDDDRVAATRGIVVAVGSVPVDTQLTSRLDRLRGALTTALAEWGPRPGAVDAHSRHDEWDILLDETNRPLRRPCAVNVGDEVIFSRDAGHEIAFADQSYVLLKEADIFAIVEPDQ